MNRLIEAARLKQHRSVVLVSLLLPTVAVLVVLQQPLAAALMPLLAWLMVELHWRDERARELAQSIAQGQPTEKLEVPQGAWGELCRAVNGMLQQRRIQDRLHAAVSTALPDDAVRAVLAGGLLNKSEPRVVTVLLVEQASVARLDAQARHALLGSWHTLAEAAQAQTHQHGALLQPCGDGFMLVFGAFTEWPTEAMAATALNVANALQRAWYATEQRGTKGLTLAVASGPAVIGVLPGLGCCVMGEPVEEALEIARLAGNTAGTQLLCGESVYYALKHNVSAGWRSTELRVAVGTGKPQPVYRWNTAPMSTEKRVQKAAG